MFLSKHAGRCGVLQWQGYWESIQKLTPLHCHEAVENKNKCKQETLNCLIRQGWLPVYGHDNYDSRMLVAAALEAGALICSGGFNLYWKDPGDNAEKIQTN